MFVRNRTTGSPGSAGVKIIESYSMNSEIRICFDKSGCRFKSAVSKKYWNRGLQEPSQAARE